MCAHLQNFILSMSIVTYIFLADVFSINKDYLIFQDNFHLHYNLTFLSSDFTIYMIFAEIFSAFETLLPHVTSNLFFREI